MKKKMKMDQDRGESNAISLKNVGWTDCYVGLLVELMFLKITFAFGCSFFTYNIAFSRCLDLLILFF